VAGIERADVKEEAALETAAPPTAERQHEQQRRIQAPAYINPIDLRLQLSSLAEMQSHIIPAQPHPRSVASAVSVESEQGLPEGSEEQQPDAGS
jgi:hypothetical protein